MKLNEFNSIFDEVKEAKPLWLEGEMEPKATDEQISEVESKLDIKLPDQYIEFIQTIGAGYFGFTNVFSVNPEGEWYLLEMMERFPLPEMFLPVSDDETGGYFGFLIQGKSCSDDVYYWHSEDEVVPELKYESFFDYIVKVGLKK